MEKNSAAPGRADPSFDEIPKFNATVISPGARLYANGRQQVAIEVVLEAVLGIESATLTDSEVASIRLVHYNTGEELSDAWTISRARNDYSFYPEPGRDASAITRVSRTGDRKPYVIELYVSTTESAGLSRKLALAITRESDGLVVITNGWTVPPFDDLTSSLTLEIVDVPTYSIQNYTFDKQIVLQVPFEGDVSQPGHAREDGGSPVFIANYHFTAVDNNNKTILFRTLEVENGGMIQWSVKNPLESFASYTGYAVPGSDDIIYSDDIKLGDQHTPEKTVRQNVKDKGTIVLVGDIDIPFHEDSAVKHGGPRGVTAIDQYGNDHELKVRFKDGTPTGRFDLVLFK
ncbi:hypothetical protein [Stenotrophomonas bentonitica]|uniref:hypothetical protein n=1 Tax=Stenotrophomonas bentonitica TaxID=1450134 RepID=UPI00345E7C74